MIIIDVLVALKCRSEKRVCCILLMVALIVSDNWLIDVLFPYMVSHLAEPQPSTVATPRSDYEVRGMGRVPNLCKGV